MTQALTTLARQMGIVPAYTDQLKRRRRTPVVTMRALLAAMGCPAETDAQAQDALASLKDRAARRRLPEWRVIEAEVDPGWGPPDDWGLTLEDGRVLDGRGALPPLPLGLHELRLADARCTLISAPARLPLPPRSWGVMAPLHALPRSGSKGGLADYGDLAELGAALAGHGAAFLGLNPLHAGFWDADVSFSPYTPSHRRRLSSLHVAARGVGSALGDIIQFAHHRHARRAALEADFATFQSTGGDRAFDTWRKAEGDPLDRFALHQALSDRHGPYWHNWPAPLQDPEGAAVQAAARDLSAETGFHAWLQWRAEGGLRAAQADTRAAGMGMGLYLDLAVGTHPSGAETWEDRASFAQGVSLGAPPDAFAADGQSWGLAPFDPHALAANGFQALAETLRRQLAFCGLLRIDHILGFDRAFWVPDGGDPGAYVQMPRDAMLAVARLEAARAGATLVGEDLGNVPRGLRGALSASGILGCKLQVFELRAGAARDPKHYPAASIASFSTHDLPTWTGWRVGQDIATHERLGHIAPEAAQVARADRAKDVAAFDHMSDAAAPQGIPAASMDRMHHALATSGSRLAMVQIENVLGLLDQPNLPGTVDSYLNWRQTLPATAKDLATHPALIRTAAIMHTHGRAPDAAPVDPGARDDRDTHLDPGL